MKKEILTMNDKFRRSEIYRKDQSQNMQNHNNTWNLFQNNNHNRPLINQ